MILSDKEVVLKWNNLLPSVDDPNVDNRGRLLLARMFENASNDKSEINQDAIDRIRKGEDMIFSGVLRKTIRQFLRISGRHNT